MWILVVAIVVIGTIAAGASILWDKEEDSPSAKLRIKNEELRMGDSDEECKSPTGHNCEGCAGCGLKGLIKS